jgi:broad specificity phosphatase PhoE
MRHAETDWQQVNERGWVGLANDFARLTERGRQQAADAARRVAELGPAMLVTSPMTRAMETAAIVGRRIGLDPVVEIDLREWLPDRNMAWSSPEEVQAAYRAMIDSTGAVPAVTAPRWETMSELRRRGLDALRPYVASGRPVVAVCHAVIIHAITGCSQTAYCEVREVIAQPE